MCEVRVFTKEITPQDPLEFTKEELKYIENFASKKRQEEFLCARAFLREIAQKHYGLKDVSVILEGKKPKLQGGEFHFSISHSRGFLAVVTSKTPVGADLEYIDQGRNVEKIIKRFSPKVQEGYKCAKDPTEHFYTVWTSYEAYIKLKGETLSAKNFEPECAKFKTQKLSNSFILTVATFS